MAGIGFELRKLLRKESYLGLLQTYAYASIISSGPWVLSIVGIIVIGLLSVAVVVPQVQIFATDIDDEALEVARAGVYPGAIAKDIAPAILRAGGELSRRLGYTG